MRAFGVLLLLVLLVGTSACSTPNNKGAETQPGISLRESRQFQNQELLQLAAYVSLDTVVGGMGAPIPQMNGMTCDWAKPGSDASVEAGVFLPGGYDIEVSSEVDLDQVLEQIRVDYLEKGWNAYWDNTGENKSVNLISPEGYEFFLTVLPSKESSQKLMMSSFSPCLQAPEGFTLFDEY